MSSGDGKARAAVDILRKAWRTAATASDLDLYMSFFTSDAVLVPAGRLPIIGLSAIRDFVEAFFNSYRITSEQIVTDEVVIAGDWAFERGPYNATYTARSGHEPIRDIGYAMYVMRRQSDGSWKYARIICNATEDRLPNQK
jgi:uncharacterized protein (TIGR02246 family)